MNSSLHQFITASIHHCINSSLHQFIRSLIHHCINSSHYFWKHNNRLMILCNLWMWAISCTFAFRNCSARANIWFCCNCCTCTVDSHVSHGPWQWDNNEYHSWHWWVDISEMVCTLIDAICDVESLLVCISPCMRCLDWYLVDLKTLTSCYWCHYDCLTPNWFFGKINWFITS